MLLHIYSLKAALIDAYLATIAEFLTNDCPIAGFQQTLGELAIFDERPKHVTATGATTTDDRERRCCVHQPLIFSVAENLYRLLLRDLPTRASPDLPP